MYNIKRIRNPSLYPYELQGQSGRKSVPSNTLCGGSQYPFPSAAGGLPPPTASVSTRNRRPGVDSSVKIERARALLFSDLNHRPGREFDAG